MANTQELRRKIKSVRSTAKLTKAMQMVAAAKMARAVERAVASRPYADSMAALLKQLQGDGVLDHPLLAQPTTGRHLVILVTSNRGLAGAFNSQVLRAALDLVDETTDIIAVGRKGQAYLRRFHPDKVVAEFAAPDGAVHFSDGTPIAHLATAGFLGGRYRTVTVVYTAFVSAIRQAATTLQLLPLTSTDDSEVAADGTVVEPSHAAVLDTLLQRAVPLRLFRCLLESSAAEQSARMLAMKNATDNANEIVDDLTLTYQSVRQAGITRQIIEIASGAAALGA